MSELHSILFLCKHVNIIPLPEPPSLWLNDSRLPWRVTRHAWVVRDQLSDVNDTRSIYIPSSCWPSLLYCVKELVSLVDFYHAIRTLELPWPLGLRIHHKTVCLVTWPGLYRQARDWNWLEATRNTIESPLAEQYKDLAAQRLWVSYQCTASYQSLQLIYNVHE